MNNLLSAGFARLKKDKCFWIGTLFMFGMGIFITLNNYYNMIKYELNYKIDDEFFGYVMFIGIVCSVFCSLYIGTEYSDGTIRNKLIIGHSRIYIYLSNFIICSIAGIFMIIAFIIPCACLGIPLLGTFKTDIRTLLFIFLGSLIMIIALTAIFTLICMLNQNKAVAAITAVLIMFALLFAATYIAMRLSEPPTYSGFFMDESGTLQQSPETPNPNYISGVKRAVYEELMLILPTGQAIQYVSLNIVWKMPFYSFLITVCAIICGIWIFQRKDIK